MNVRIKGGLQSEALRKLQTYLDAHPEEAAGLAMSLMVDLVRKLTITETEQWITLLDEIIDKDISWSSETEAE
jgi:hypothetical protein